MLTGDGVDAAISVADTAGLLSNTDSIAVLDIVSPLNDLSLVWRIMRKPTSKTKNISSFKLLDTLNLTHESVERMLRNSENGDCSLVVTGKATELLLSSSSIASTQLYSHLRDNLDHFTIFARASPKQKRSIVSNLKEQFWSEESAHVRYVNLVPPLFVCVYSMFVSLIITYVDCTIGDGVNDVAAMKVADVGAALLNGYENEGSNSNDLEDKRRLEQLSKRKIGSNRRRGFSPESCSRPYCTLGHW